MAKSDPIPAVGRNHSANNLPAALRRNRASPGFDLAALDRENAIALAERLPVQSVRVVQEHFGRAHRAGGALGGAIQNFDELLVCDAQRMRDNHDGMQPPAQIGGVNVPRFHGRESFFAARRMER